MTRVVQGGIGWLDWFKCLPEDLREGILAFMDTQVPIMAACQVPSVVPKAAPSVRSSRRRAEAYSGPCLTHRFC